MIGNLAQDPELRHFPNGGAVCNVTVATSEKWKDKQTGEAKELTEWNRIVFSNRLAEIAAEYLRKGSKVYIEGSLRTRKYQDNQGVERYTTEIRASQMQMLDSRAQGQGQSQPQAQAQAQRKPQPQQYPPIELGPGLNTDFADDAPF